jgi:hypothetical protein
MRKVLAAFLLFLSTLMLTAQPVYADNPSAGDIFNSIGGTTTIDRGGSIHSQARSIYSLGGGMVSFEGKKVSLLAADPPSFSAGCSGISWHFGGFAFISLDEIRQLVEAVAQASLGVAVDLAMQTLCPQCYAVMAKLRDISNMMRNAAADACRIAENMASLLQSSALSPTHSRTSQCSTQTADTGQTSSFMDSAAGATCRLLSDAEGVIDKTGDEFMKFMQGGNKATSSGGKANLLALNGNMTYKALTALGYPDGVAKDVLLSLLGMTIVSPKPANDCSFIFANLHGSSSLNDTGISASDQVTIDHLLSTQSALVVTSSTGGEPTVNDQKVTPANGDATGAAVGQVVCNAPPILTGFDSVGRVLMCGFNVSGEKIAFAAQYYNGSLPQLNNTSLGALCPTMTTDDAQNPMIYDCPDAASTGCIQPMVKRFDTLFPSRDSGTYTGLAWMIADALYKGAQVIENNSGPLPAATIRILTGSGYPLYRLLNMAAVYPGMAADLLNAYTSAIATQYVLDTLDKLTRIGAQPAINIANNPGLKPESISVVREQLMTLVRMGDATKTLPLERLAEKNKLIDVILNVNKTLQAEVIGQGLTGNNDLAVALKRQESSQATPK